MIITRGPGYFPIPNTASFLAIAKWRHLPRVTFGTFAAGTGSLLKIMERDPCGFLRPTEANGPGHETWSGWLVGLPIWATRRRREFCRTSPSCHWEKIIRGGRLRARLLRMLPWRATIWRWADW